MKGSDEDVFRRLLVTSVPFIASLRRPTHKKRMQIGWSVLVTFDENRYFGIDEDNTGNTGKIPVLEIFSESNKFVRFSGKKK